MTASRMLIVSQGVAKLMAGRADQSICAACRLTVGLNRPAFAGG